jgi:hypothetical protein
MTKFPKHLFKPVTRGLTLRRDRLPGAVGAMGQT